MNDRRKYSLFAKPLGACIDTLTRPLLKENGLAGTRILTDWPSIVGAELALRSAPEKLSFSPGKKTNGTLMIAVENGFATEFSYMQPLILDRINGYFGYQAVTKLTFSPRLLPPSPPPPNMHSNQPRKTVNTSVTIPENTDPELKEALKSLANTLAGQ